METDHRAGDQRPEITFRRACRTDPGHFQKGAHRPAPGNGSRRTGNPGRIQRTSAQSGIFFNGKRACPAADSVPAGRMGTEIPGEGERWREELHCFKCGNDELEITVISNLNRNKILEFY